MIEFDEVPAPDESARAQARERQRQLTKPLGSLGRLEELGNWLAACQGSVPPRPLRRPRLVIFAGDHGIAARGVSAYPAEVTGQMVSNVLAGGAAANVLADSAGASVRLVDMSVNAETPESVRANKVRSGSVAIDRQESMSTGEAKQALAAGKAIADEEVDSGADLLIPGDLGIGNTTPAAVLVSALTGAEPVAVIGRGTGIDDTAWMRKASVIRDARRRAVKVLGDPAELLRTTAGADLTAMAGFLAQAAVRKTPVILDGVVATAVALVADSLAPGARNWWIAGHRSPEPAHEMALDQLSLRPLLDLDMRLGEGSGALAALPLVNAAGRLLAEMATFAEAGVSSKPNDE